MLENHLKKDQILFFSTFRNWVLFLILFLAHHKLGCRGPIIGLDQRETSQVVELDMQKSGQCSSARNQRRRWVTRAWEVMPSQSLVIGFYLGMRSHMILVVIPHDKQRYLYSSFCFQNLFFMHDLSNFVTSITEVKITPCFYFKQKPRKNLHLIITELFHLKLFQFLFCFSIKS